MRCRSHGDQGPWVVLLHGGPGAPGYMAPVARVLAGYCRVLEPFQRGSGVHPLTVAQHVADLADLIDQRCDSARPALVGSSWGAMLALAFAAERPVRVSSLALIGCGTFDLEARARLLATVSERTDAELSATLARIHREIEDPDERLAALGSAVLRIYSCDVITTDLETDHVDARAHQESWADMVRLQECGRYPRIFERIQEPVLMLHGDQDPHPGAMIRDSLRPFLPQLVMHELLRCGHYPWIERHAHGEFFARLERWLLAEAGPR